MTKKYQLDRAGAVSRLKKEMRRILTEEGCIEDYIIKSTGELKDKALYGPIEASQSTFSSGKASRKPPYEIIVKLWLKYYRNGFDLEYVMTGVSYGPIIKSPHKVFDIEYTRPENLEVFNLIAEMTTDNIVALIPLLRNLIKSQKQAEHEKDVDVS